MREILFRGQDINGNWYIGNLAVLNKKSGSVDPGTYISNSAGMPFAYQVRPETVGQFTGLTDKNGTKIFEGDEVEYSVFYIEDDYHEGTGYWEWTKESDFVIFDDCTFCLEGTPGVPLDSIEYVNGVTNEDTHPFPEDFESGLKVIGNIHENTEK